MPSLPSAISNLSTEEKFDLIDALWEDLATDSSAVTAEQRTELEGRLARYERDPSNVIPWEQVSATLFKER